MAKNDPRTSRPLKRMPSLPELQRVLISLSETVDGHWIWLGAVNKVSGYPVMKFDRETEYVARFMVQVFKGKMPPGHQAGHNHKLGCPRRCVNPFHLDVQSQADNAADSNRRTGNRYKGKDKKSKVRYWPIFDEQKDVIPESLTEHHHQTSEHF